MTLGWARKVLTFVGRAGDRNNRAMKGAALLGDALAQRLELDQVIIGTPAPATSLGWQDELAAAKPELLELQAAHALALAAEHPTLTVLSRCAAALATLPNLALARPDALVVWFDAHGDLNTPASTRSGYLGGMVLAAALGWWDSGLGSGLEARNLILGGTRDLDPFEKSVVDSGTVKLAAGPGMLSDLDRLIGDWPVYFHLDCDVLSPGIVATDYAVPAGLSLRELKAVATRLARNEVIGIQIAEYQAPDRARSINKQLTGLMNALTPLLEKTEAD
ncbi:MAG: arginase family protein [Propionibacteriaceae bacterium]|jgi:arginase family enzyme|nr:arginase family protein [Propionibacteriaceae bacterium]